MESDVVVSLEYVLDHLVLPDIVLKFITNFNSL